VRPVPGIDYGDHDACAGSGVPRRGRVQATVGLEVLPLLAVARVVGLQQWLHQAVFFRVFDIRLHGHLRDQRTKLSRIVMVDDVQDVRAMRWKSPAGITLFPQVSHPEFGKFRSGLCQISQLQVHCFCERLNHKLFSKLEPQPIA